METRLGTMLIFGAAVLSATACGNTRDAAHVPARAPEIGKISAGLPPKDSAADADVPGDGGVGGNALPPGYHVVLDKSDAKVSDISYTPAGTGRWEVRTGPAHLLFSPKDTVKKQYALNATFEQLDKPMHPEAYGVFWGGTSLNDPAKQRYTYFLVRGDGKFMVKVRQGASTRTITDWSAHAGLPHEDASGKVLFGVKVDVDSTGARVSVNGVPITTIPAKGNPMQGQSGVRINHNLHLDVTPVAVTRS
jgi:hypothetical protein